MKFVKFIAMVAVLLTVTSCGSLTKSRSYSFNDVRLEMGMSDLQYLGEEEISVEYTSYLWCIKSFEKVNGEIYNPSNRKELTMPRSCNFRNRNLDKAAYKLVEKFPEAVYFQIVFETKNADRLFLGSVNKETARVRAYKLRNNPGCCR